MNIKEEQAKMREKAYRRKHRLPPLPHNQSAATQNRQAEARKQKRLHSLDKNFASGKEIADAIGQLFD